MSWGNHTPPSDCWLTGTPFCIVHAYIHVHEHARHERVMSEHMHMHMSHVHVVVFVPCTYLLTCLLTGADGHVDVLL